MGRGRTVAVVGGGAAGLAAAIAAGRAGMAHGDGSEGGVVVYESDERVGRSVLATGNGRCNFSNARIDPKAYRNGPFAAAALAALERSTGSSTGAVALGLAVDPKAGALGAKARAASAEPSEEACLAAGSVRPNAVLRFFSSCGLAWREEGQGRLYPVTNKASTVLDVLRAAARACGVEERCGNAVRAVEPPREPGGRFTLRMADGAFERADAVVVAVGGRDGLELLPAGVPTSPLAPVLGPLRTEKRPIRALDNIRVRCEASLRRGEEVVAREVGEILFRKYGVSGIAAFNLSRAARPGDELAIDLFAETGRLGGDLAGGACADASPSGTARPSARERAEALLLRRRAELAPLGLAGTCGDVLRGLLLPLVAEAVCEAAEVLPDDRPTDAALARIAGAASAFALRIEGIGDARQCQVHRGGVAPEALDAETMAVTGMPGLFVAGEAVDVDAPCGGGNLHWAWASGLLAGLSAAFA